MSYTLDLSSSLNLAEATTALKALKSSFSSADTTAKVAELYLRLDTDFTQLSCADLIAFKQTYQDLKQQPQQDATVQQTMAFLDELHKLVSQEFMLRFKTTFLLKLKGMFLMPAAERHAAFDKRLKDLRETGIKGDNDFMLEASVLLARFAPDLLCAHLVDFIPANKPSAYLIGSIIHDAALRKKYGETFQLDLAQLEKEHQTYQKRINELPHDALGHAGICYGYFMTLASQDSPKVNQKTHASARFIQAAYRLAHHFKERCEGIFLPEPIRKRLNIKKSEGVLLFSPLVKLSTALTNFADFAEAGKYELRLKGPGGIHSIYLTFDPLSFADPNQAFDTVEGFQVNKGFQTTKELIAALRKYVMFKYGDGCFDTFCLIRYS